MNEQPTTIDIAAQAYIEAKAAEDRARDARLAAEEKILELVGFKEEGTKSIKTTWFKVSTIGKLTRTIIPEALDEVRSHVHEFLYEQVIRYKPELNLGALRNVEEAFPDAYREFIKAIITKPAKTAIKIELIEEKR